MSAPDWPEPRWVERDDVDGCAVPADHFDPEHLPYVVLLARALDPARRATRAADVVRLGREYRELFGGSSDG